jgi:PAS domain S-box-containing protein
MQPIASMQDRMLTVLDNVYEAIVTIDESGEIRTFNKAAERIFGFAATGAVGSPVTRLMPAPYASRHDDCMSHYQRGRTPHIIRIAAVDAGGGRLV